MASSAAVFQGQYNQQQPTNSSQLTAIKQAARQTKLQTTHTRQKRSRDGPDRAVVLLHVNIDGGKECCVVWIRQV
jgi:hypothetical protein